MFLTADRLLLEIDLGSVPVLQRDADLADDEVASALHPVGAFLADPDHGIEIFWLLCSVFEAHQVARRVSPWVGAKPDWVQRKRAAVCQANELPHGMERDLGVVRAGLDRQVAAGVVRLELVAVEFGQIDQGVRPR